MDAPAISRTPLHAMSDEQLLFYAEDDLASAWKRDLAEQLLLERLGDELENRKVPVLVGRIAEYGHDLA